MRKKINTTKILFFMSIMLSCISCVFGLETPQLFFQEAAPDEASEIQQRMINFYGQQLFEAKVVEDKTKAQEAALDECLQNPNKIYYYLLVSELETKYGYLAYTIDHHTAYLEALYLEQEYRGQGLAKKTLQNFETLLKEKNIDTVQLYVFAHNQPAIKLYEKLGYFVENAYSNGSNLIGYRMKKNLQGAS